jgi:hypothetical protein
VIETASAKTASKLPFANLLIGRDHWEMVEGDLQNL